MSRASLVTYGILVLVVMFVGQNFFHQIGAYKTEIAAAKKEKAEMIASREQLLQKVQELTQAQARLQIQVQEKETAITGLRTEVKELKDKLADDHVEIVRIQTDDQSMARFAEEFPEFSHGMRMVERTVPNAKHPERVVRMNYIMLPVGFVDHFIDLKKTAASYQLQTAKLGEIDGLNTQIKSLQQGIIDLGRAKEVAYHQGYEEAFKKYTDLSDAYVKLMKEKRFSAGTSLFQAAGAFVGGLALGSGL